MSQANKCLDCEINESGGGVDPPTRTAGGAGPGTDGDASAGAAVGPVRRTRRTDAMLALTPEARVRMRAWFGDGGTRRADARRPSLRTPVSAPSRYGSCVVV